MLISYRHEKMNARYQNCLDIFKLEYATKVRASKQISLVLICFMFLQLFKCSFKRILEITEKSVKSKQGTVVDGRVIRKVN